MHDTLPIITKADAPDQKWTTDVTQVKIKDRKLFLSPILDMFNGEIISYQISSCPNMKMVLTMLKKALNKKKDLSGLILHSDQGWQYQQQRSPSYYICRTGNRLMSLRKSSGLTSNTTTTTE